MLPDIDFEEDPAEWERALRAALSRKEVTKQELIDFAMERAVDAERFRSSYGALLHQQALDYAVAALVDTTPAQREKNYKKHGQILNTEKLLAMEADRKNTRQTRKAADANAENEASAAAKVRRRLRAMIANGEDPWGRDVAGKLAGQFGCTSKAVRNARKKLLRDQRT